MTFFPPPTGTTPETEHPPPELPPWFGPPRSERGVVVGTNLLLSRSAHVAVVLPQITVHSTGCLLSLEVATRRGGLAREDWWDLIASVGDTRVPSRRWDRVLRVGLRYPDGTTVTNVDPDALGDGDAEPDRPVMSWTPTGSGGSRQYNVATFGMWLWPLPPAAPLQVGVEWPRGDIALTITELDGIELTAAAAGVTGYWPDEETH